MTVVSGLPAATIPEADWVTLMLMSATSQLKHSLTLGSMAVHLREAVALSLWQPHLPFPSSTVGGTSYARH